MDPVKIIALPRSPFHDIALMSDKPFTFICGDDDYLVSEKGRAWFAEQTKDLMDDLSKEVVDGRAGNIAEVEEIMARFTCLLYTSPSPRDRG